MINSMTGYGEAEGEIDGVTYAVEIRALNHRYLKVNIRLPESAGFLERDVDKLLRQNLSRGTISCVLQVKHASTKTLFDINEVALRACVEKLGRVVNSADMKCAIDIGGLLSLPGIIEPASPEEETAERIKEKILDITQQAIDEVKKMRATEGVALAADLDSHCAAVKQGLERIRARSTTVLKEHREKLRKRVDELLAGAGVQLDEQTLAKEVAVFAERSDISEEIARLDSHLGQFTASCQQESKAGRRLEFISQEMLRETNTIASKASDAEIARYVVDIKCRIDRIKEQIQNIE